MFNNSSVGRKVFIYVAIIIGLAVGIIGVGQAIASNSNNQNIEVSPTFLTNENGQTYGSNANCTSLETEPDLIKAIAMDGTEGYVLSKDLHGDMPKTPEEALAIQKKDGNKDKIIPLYAVDGKTVIGEFKIEGNVKNEKIYSKDQ